MKPKNSWAWLLAGKEGLVDWPWAPWAEGKLRQPHTDSERAHYKHCNLVSAPALIKGSLDTLRPLQITD